MVRGVKSKRVQRDKLWFFAHCNQKNVETAEAASAGAGDVWTWTALDADNAFMQDVAGRLATRLQLTTDAHKLYLEAVEGAFGADVNYAVLVKVYGAAPESAKGRYSPAECTGTRKTRVEGRSDPAHVSTSYVERQNLTMRMHMRRFTRLTNGFSKKIEAHVDMVALYSVWYNFVRIHKTLRVTPAMATGVSDRLWSMEDMVAPVDAQAGPPKKRGSYKPHTIEA